MNLGSFTDLKKINGVDSVIVGPNASVEAQVILIDYLSAKHFRKERV